MTVSEAAKIANCNGSTIRRLMNEGKIAGYKTPHPIKPSITLWVISDDKMKIRDVVNHSAPRHGFHKGTRTIKNGNGSFQVATNGSVPVPTNGNGNGNGSPSVITLAPASALALARALAPAPAPAPKSSSVLELVVLFKALSEPKRTMLRKLMDRSEAELSTVLDLLEEV